LVPRLDAEVICKRESGRQWHGFHQPSHHLDVIGILGVGQLMSPWHRPKENRAVSK